jgi:hypothetical protein
MQRAISEFHTQRGEQIVTIPQQLHQLIALVRFRRGTADENEPSRGIAIFRAIFD